MNRHARRAWKRKVRDMAVIKMDITFDGKDKSGKPNKYTKNFELAPEKIPLALIEALEEKRMGLARRGIKKYLGLTQEESEQLTVEHLNQFGKAVMEAQDIPND